jgi:hypothetical protein
MDNGTASFNAFLPYNDTDVEEMIKKAKAATGALGKTACDPMIIAPGDSFMSWALFWVGGWAPFLEFVSGSTATAENFAFPVGGSSGKAVEFAPGAADAAALAAYCEVAGDVDEVPAAMSSDGLVADCWGEGASSAGDGADDGCFVTKAAVSSDDAA